MIETIFIDLDGVIRHWDGCDIAMVERESSLTTGVLFSVAFEPAHVKLVTTGRISHEAWMQRVSKILCTRYEADVAISLMDAWQNASFTIDYELLDRIRTECPGAKLVLAANATSKLSSDIERSKLGRYFSAVLNSSEIGVTKPTQSFYIKALSLTDSSAANCLYIDDSIENVNTANSLGFLSCLHKEPSKTLQFVKQNTR